MTVYEKTEVAFNPLTGKLKPQSNGPQQYGDWYTWVLMGGLLHLVQGAWAGCSPPPLVPSSLYQM